MTSTRLLEEWLPFDTIGAESLRDASAAQKPPLNRIHVWWARRPLTVSRAAIVASVLPSYDTLRQHPRLAEIFPSQEAYQAWYLRLLGILGDPVEARERIGRAKEMGIKLDVAYTHSRAFTVNPSTEDLTLLRRILKATWGTDELTVLDPFSGGGSIPFEALRYGFNTIANELNPVAAVILKATLDYPARYGARLTPEIKKWGQEWSKRVRERLTPYFPKQPNENIFAYLWARTVACPVTGKPVPLSPNWWLSKTPRVAVELLTEPEWEAPRFRILDERDLKKSGYDPDEGTISRGVARSPWTGDTVDGDYIKSEAQAGRMGQMLYAIAIKRRGGFDFRAPTEEDLAAIRAAEQDLAKKRPLWEAMGLVPNEERYIGPADRSANYGIHFWSEAFSPRQLLTIAVFMEQLREIAGQFAPSLGTEKSKAIITYLGFALNKAVNYSSYLASWHASRAVMRSVFDRHDFSFKWTFGEFDGAANLLPWGLDQVEDAYDGISKLIKPDVPTFGNLPLSMGDLTIHQGSAPDMEKVADKSVHAIVTDPPYYDNVMYAELSDFFFVWLKRTVGHLYPEWFTAELTDKDEEAVANPARFADLGRKRAELAAQDYERKMAAAFKEMHRVLTDDGILTVMFTHKRVEAWDTLASALISAGFTIESSWPVHTESEHSLHQAKKNAAQSTILLACRKRAAAGAPVWWDDIRASVARTAREHATEFEQNGIHGVDLYISTFGPVLSVISQQWPVLTSEVDERTGQPKALRPEVALDLARREVLRLRKEGLLGGRDTQFDTVTDWAIMAWDAFQAEEFPADEARKMAIAVGIDDLEKELVARRVISKKGKNVVMLQPKERRGKGRVAEDAHMFAAWLDAVHTAMLIMDEDGSAAVQSWLKRTGFTNDNTFKEALKGLLYAVPRAKKKGVFVRPEAATLEALVTTFFADEIPLPPDVAVPDPALEQMEMDIEGDDE